jgi:hypothetical protein
MKCDVRIFVKDYRGSGKWPFINTGASARCECGRDHGSRFNGFLHFVKAVETALSSSRSVPPGLKPGVNEMGVKYPG